MKKDSPQESADSEPIAAPLRLCEVDGISYGFSINAAEMRAPTVARSTSGMSRKVQEFVLCDLGL